MLRLLILFVTFFLENHAPFTHVATKTRPRLPAAHERISAPIEAKSQTFYDHSDERGEPPVERPNLPFPKWTDAGRPEPRVAIKWPAAFGTIAD